MRIKASLRVLLPLLLGVLVLTPSCNRSPEARKARYLEAGRRLYDQKDYPRAILEFKNAVDVAQRDPEPSYRLGLAYLATKDYKQAAQSFSNAARLDPKHAGAQLRLAEILTASDDPELLQEALSRLKIVLETSTSADALHAIALTELKLGNPDQAQQHLEEALSRFPQELSLYVVLAKSKLLRNDWAGAEATLKKAVAAAPKSPDAVVALGTFYIGQRRLPEAEKLLRQALELDPRSGQALFEMALLQFNTGRQAAAGEIFKKLSTFSEPQYQPLHAIFLFKQGDKEGAVAELEKLCRQNPKSRELRAQLVASYWVVNRLDKLEALLQTALKQNPKDFDALLQRGEMYMAQGKYAPAQADLDQVLSYKRDSAVVHYILAKLYQARGADLTYRQELTEAVRLSPDLLLARLDLARALTASGAAQSALNILDEAPAAQKRAFPFFVERNWAWLALGKYADLRQGVKAGLAIERNPDLLIQSGWVGIADRNYLAARSAIEEALQKAPSDTRALEALAALYNAQKKTAELDTRLRQYATTATSPEVRLFVGNWVLQNGDREGARQFFRSAKLADPKFDEADLALALIDASEGKLDAARNTLNALLSNRDQDMRLRLQSAILETSARRYPEAIGQYRKILSVDRNNLLALNNIAYLLANTNQPDEALTFAQQAKEVAPGVAAVEDTLGWVLYRKGIYTAAVSYLESAAQKTDNPAVQYHLGMAYVKVGNRERGERILKAALKTAPELQEADEGRQMIAAAK
jgi:tetratricopeptide (TPR) repeat protein